MGCSKSSSKREFYSYISSLQVIRKISNKQPNLIPKETRERRTTKSIVSRKKEIIKIRAEMSEIEVTPPHKTGKKPNPRKDQ